ncbi:MAG: DUF4124 domain-containing protein [Alphaproteobacteria bacterium]|nr:DUF4124 domain-containing protein [Alphaproteobacteria bacterium]MDE2496153.1 DUF4124 domain-containing protein [Alphaproteobacteria bacterium]
MWLIICVLLSVGAVLTEVKAQSYPVRPTFSPNSFWYQPIPTSVALNPNSAGYVAEFLRQLNTYYGTVGINTTAYSTPVYTVDAYTTAVPVQQWSCQGYLDPGLAQQLAAVPIPSYAQPADGTDAEMTIYQPSSDSMWEFWRARQASGQWQACWGGKMSGVSTNPGIWPPHYGVAATGLPFAPGQVTVQELKSGAIKHAIGIALVDTAASTVFSWPANRSDGINTANAPNRIPEGLRFRLDPAVNVDALNIHPIAKLVAKAAQTYGFVVWDRAGSISLRFENPKVYTIAGQPNPYIALWNGAHSYAILNGIPWNRLQFLPMNYGKP